VSALRLREIVLDCPDPRELAEFYRRLLDWPYAPGHADPDPEGDDWLVLVAPDDGPRLAFQHSEAAPPPWSRDSTVGRVHVDVAVENLEDAHDAAVAAGARPVSGTPEEDGHPADRFRVYADPAGHPFCLVQDVQ
jgi:catechol 2,3-dioxygenase-like lactoylglutathione lyase family enzyme